MPNTSTPGWRSVPSLKFALLFVLGIIAGTSSLLSLVEWSVLVFVDIVVLTYLFVRSSPLPFGNFLTQISAGVLVLACGAVRVGTERNTEISLPPALLNREIELTGVVADVPQIRGRMTRFVFETDSLIEQVLAFRVRVMTTVLQTARDTSTPVLRYGDRLKIRGILDRPLSPRNPGEYNPALYLEANSLWGFFFIRGWHMVAVQDSGIGSFWMRKCIVPARKAMFHLIDKTVGGEEGEFLKGLLLGDRSGISPSTKQAFVNAGVAHILAVSGAHVAVVASVFMFLFRFFRLPRPAHTILVAVGLVFYMVLTGSHPPVVRATVMALIFLAGGMVQRSSNSYNALGASAILILLWHARQLFDVGFQLSFTAVFSIIHFYPRVNTVISRMEGDGLFVRGFLWVARLFAVSLVAAVGTLPLTAISFGRISIIGLAANLVIIPAAGLSIILGATQMIAALVSDWAASVFGVVNGLVIRWILSATRYAASLPLAYVDAYRFTALDAIPYYAAMILIFHLSDRLVVRVFVPVLLFGLNLLVYVHPATAGARAPGILTVSVIDVGQGDAILVEFPRGETMLVDAGPKTLSFDAGLKTVYPYLKRRGITRIDFLVVTHPHADHLGGTPVLLRLLSVGEVLDCGQPVRSGLFRDYENEIAESHRTEHAARAGDVIPGPSNVRLYVLSPVPAMIDTDRSHIVPNLNNTSVVIRLLYGRTSILLAGDAEAEAEHVMISRYSPFLGSTLLKVGHHGSITSSTPDFLRAVHPEFVVISVGRHNKFHHPSQIVLRRFEKLGADIARTDEDGAVIYQSDGYSLRRILWR